MAGITGRMHVRTCMIFINGMLITNIRYTTKNIYIHVILSFPFPYVSNTPCCLTFHLFIRLFTCYASLDQIYQFYVLYIYQLTCSGCMCVFVCIHVSVRLSFCVVHLIDLHPPLSLPISLSLSRVV